MVTQGANPRKMTTVLPDGHSALLPNSERMCPFVYHELSSKERILRCITGLPTDRPAWSPFLAYYFEHLPQPVQEAGQFAYLKELGADPLLRGFTQCFATRYEKCQIRSWSTGNITRTSYETPVGILTEESTYVPSANTTFLTRHPVETQEDFKVLQYLFENLNVIEAPEDFYRQYRLIGEQGLLVPVFGCGLKTAFQSLVEHWCGTENLTYAVYDFPDTVRECLHVMWRRDLQTLEYTLNTPAEALIFWEDSSTTNISPQFFETYTMPQITQWAERTQKASRLLLHHACGHIRDLLEPMARCGIDVIESISPPPTGNVELAHARAVLPDSIGLIGGIEPTFLNSCTVEELVSYVRNLLGQMKDSRFILANSDSCPPTVSREKLLAISKLIASGEFH